MADETITITGEVQVMAALARVPADVKAKAMPEFKNAADGTLVDAQDRCPYDEVHHRGPEPHLRDTGRVEEIEDGYSVAFGDESGDYGYSWYIETGHRTRSGSMVPPQAYLGPAFEQNADELLMMLNGIIP